MAPATFEVDPLARAVHWRGVRLDLTRYEYRLLTTLLAHPGRVYTREELLERVWSEAEDTEARTVDTHVKTLRAKLRAAAPGDDPIQTHRGVGYSVGPCA